jgi:uncharacterized membrane protein
LVYEEGIFEVEAISRLLVPYISKTTIVHKPQIVLKIIRMYYINYHMTNHNITTKGVPIPPSDFIGF